MNFNRLFAGAVSCVGGWLPALNSGVKLKALGMGMGQGFANLKVWGWGY
ncbi:MAG: hypothetical protein KME19_09230 [Microcoleus vaginatus WJT46-NPBG5]|nr:hypothetical protein [Microcoleus vaginatus WJT46-NPBG5]